MKKLNTLILSDKLLFILNKINRETKGGDRISKKLLHLNYNSDYGFNISYIDITDKIDYISYISSNKTKDTNYNWTKNRNNQKIGRFLYQILKEDASIIEDFVNKFKTEIKVLNNNFNFKIIKGNDISKYYSEKYYVPGGGSLNKSCMRHDKCQNYFYFYESNDDKINMLVLYDNTKTKIIGRALIWYIDDPKITIMDRIYTTFDSDKELFIQYAKKMKWHYKKTQSPIEKKIIDLKGNEIDLKCKILLKKEKYQYYPYLDTFYFYDIKNNYLTNDILDYKKNKYIIRLRSTDGGDKGNENFIYDKYNDDYIDITLSKSTVTGNYIYKRDVLRINNALLEPDIVRFSEYDWKLYYRDDVRWSYYHNSYVYKNNLFKVFLDENMKQYDYIHNDFNGEIFDYVYNKDCYFLKNLLIKGIDNKFYLKNEYDEKKIKEKLKSKDRFDEVKKLNNFFDEFIVSLSNNTDDILYTKKFFK
jgi:hypothetical protein